MKKMKTLTVNGVTYTVEDPDAANIDDGKIGPDAWSSKNTVDKLCPLFTESGSVVTCAPVEGYPLGVVSKIEPIQEGSGDPTPEVLGDNIYNVGNACTLEAVEEQWMSAVHREYEVGVTYRFSVKTSITPNRITLSKANDADAESETFDNTNVCEYTFSQENYDLERRMVIRVEWDDGVPDDYENCTLCPVMQKGNIRPITGHSEVKLWREGKNLLPYPYVDSSKTTKEGVTYTDNGDGTITLNGTPTSSGGNTFTLATHVELKDGVEYFANDGTEERNVNVYIQYLNEDGVKKWYSKYTTPSSLVWNKNYTLIKVYIQLNEIKTFNNVIIRPQLEVGSTATPYEPYRGETFTIDFGQSVYGGSFNWVTGELVIDRKMITLDGTEPWGETHSSTSDTGVDNRKRYYLDMSNNSAILPGVTGSSSSEVLDSRLVCSVLPTKTARDTWYNVDGIASMKNHNTDAIFVYCEQYATDIEGFKEMMKGAQIVFGLAEPVTIQLTPQEILALSGENTVYSDTGDTEVTGRADPVAIIEAQQAVINSVLNRVTALEAAAVDNI